MIRPFKGGLGSIAEIYHLAILARRAKSIDRATEAWRWIPEALSLGLLGSFGSVALVRYYAIFGGSGNQSCVLSCDVTQYQNCPSLDTFQEQLMCKTVSQSAANFHRNPSRTTHRQKDKLTDRLPYKKKNNRPTAELSK